MINKFCVFPALGAAFMALVSCGYHVGGRADLVPKSIQTIYIPAFTTFTTRYKLVDVLPKQIGREFVTRTRFRIVNDPSEADAILKGSINTVTAYPTVFDPTSGKATSIQIAVSATFSLIEQRTGRVLFSRPNFTARQNYEIPVDPHQYFDERDPAFDRLSRDVAHDIVSAILENF
ncbi:MAG TPA: LPS assembly lipoprotein LptE [Bryobacteraceae bacterium]|nr:LPS assembly lipoprotein LptE [Bryobacteraceae bacterium]